MVDPTLEDALSALADPSRRRIVARLALDRTDGEHACGSFDLPVSKATRTHHFKVLRRAGLIDQRQHGNGSAVTLRRTFVDGRWPGLLDLVVADAERTPAPGTTEPPPARASLNG